MSGEEERGSAASTNESTEDTATDKTSDDDDALSGVAENSDDERVSDDQIYKLTAIIRNGNVRCSTCKQNAVSSWTEEQTKEESQACEECIER